MKYLILPFLILTACGQSEDAAGLSEFNYNCQKDEDLSGGGFNVYACAERTTQVTCEVIQSTNEYFNDTDCLDFSFVSFENYLRDVQANNE